MSIVPRPYRRALIAIALALAGGALVPAASPRPAPARAATIDQLQQQIHAGEGRASDLAGALGAATGQLHQLDQSIGALATRIQTIQRRLDADRQNLLWLRSQLDAARIRLKQLETQNARDSTVLAAQLVATYEGDRPDLVSVVLNSTGFRDLLERLSFQQRIRNQNASVIAAVRAARHAEIVQATRLGALELRQQRLTRDVLDQRNELAQVKVGLVQQELKVAGERDAKAGALADVRGRVADLKRQLGGLLAIQAAQAAAAARAAAAQSAAAADAQSAGAGTGAPAFAPAQPSQPASGGGFTFPLPTGAVVGPGSWSLDDGVDMSAPGDTPEFAVCSGTIVLHGIGGFGPWAPVLHCDTPVDGYSYVYYGHAGPADQLPVGTHVSAGQVMSSIGPGIVGISTGPHVEIGFCDSSGTPIGPSSAPAMMALLRGSY